MFKVGDKVMFRVGGTPLIIKRIQPTTKGFQRISNKKHSYFVICELKINDTKYQLTTIAKALVPCNSRK